MTCSLPLPTLPQRKVPGCKEDDGAGAERKAGLRAAGGGRTCRGSRNPQERAWRWGSGVTSSYIMKILLKETSGATSGCAFHRALGLCMRATPSGGRGAANPLQDCDPAGPCALLAPLQGQHGFSPALPGLTYKRQQVSLPSLECALPARHQGPAGVGAGSRCSHAWARSRAEPHVPRPRPPRGVARGRCHPGPWHGTALPPTAPTALQPTPHLAAPTLWALPPPQSCKRVEKKKPLLENRWLKRRLKRRCSLSGPVLSSERALRPWPRSCTRRSTLCT